MLHRVVVPFPCSWDGITLVDLNVGDERDFGTMAAGLVAIGKIEPVEAKPIAAKLEVAVAEIAVEPAFEMAVDATRGRKRK